MLKKMMTLIGILIIGSSVSACSQNPALNVSPDNLAQAINGFDKATMTLERPSECGVYLADPEKAKTYFLVKMNIAGYQKACPDYAAQLAAYLNTFPSLAGISANDMQAKATWQHYFQSSHAIGKMP